MKLKLKKPIDYEGKHYDELDYDFDNLTGDDLLTAEAEITMAGVVVPIIDLSKAYNAAVFARAANIDYGMMRKLSARDFTKATQESASFLNV